MTPSPKPASDALLIGAGDLGTEIGLRLTAAGHNVVAIRRRADLVPSPMRGVAGDIHTGLPQVPRFSGPGGGPELLVFCLTAGGRDVAAYRDVFLEGMSRVLRDVTARGWAPRRALFVSSTGVCAASGSVDEATPPEPASPTSQVLLEAEQQFLHLLPPATIGIVVRPSGLYGPGREWFIEQVRDGRVPNPSRMTHRIHRDDAAAAITHLLTMTTTPEELYLLTDDAPVQADEVARFIATKVGASWSPAPVEPRGAGAPERHLSNARLKATGFEFAYPTYREGYAAVLENRGTRHP